MQHKVLDFFTKLLSRIRQPILPHINVYKPVHRLVRSCGRVRAGPNELEEILFLCTLAAKLKQDSYLVNFFLEPPEAPADSPHRTRRDSVDKDFALVSALLALTESPDAQVAIKACEGLLLVASLPEAPAASLLVDHTDFCPTLVKRLIRCYRGLPAELTTSELELLTSGSTETQWGLRWGVEEAGAPSKRRLNSFLSLFDYLDQLMVEAHDIVAVALANKIREDFLEEILETHLLTSYVRKQDSDCRHPLFATALLTRCLAMTKSPQLLKAFVVFILGTASMPEPLSGDSDPHVLRGRLIERCGQDDEGLAIATLRLFEVLLSKPDETIYEVLLLRNLRSRSYIDAEIAISGSTTRGPPNGLDKELATFIEDLDLVAFGVMEEEDSPNIVSHSPQDSVMWFMNLIPEETKSSGEDNGYEVYLMDAHAQVSGAAKMFSGCDWTETTVNRDEPFFEGNFLRMLLKRMEKLLDGRQSYELSLQVTAILSLIAVFPHPCMNEFWLSPWVALKEGVKTPCTVLRSLAEDLQQGVNGFPRAEFLLAVRDKKERLQNLGTSSRSEYSPEKEAFLEGAILLEEFCKELSSIVLVKDQLAVRNR